MTPIMTRILVPVDFSPGSEHALAYAAALTLRVGAHLGLLHVVEDPTASAWSEYYVPDLARWRADLVAGAEKRIAACRAALTGAPPEIDTAVRVGHAASTIVEFARTERFDLIVMGTHGRTGLTHLLMGSVAERVVRTASCPVLTVR
jgi:nucleotide-binding universal stress UspA family protein